MLLGRCFFISDLTLVDVDVDLALVDLDVDAVENDLVSSGAGGVGAGGSDCSMVGTGEGAMMRYLHW